MRKGFVSSVVMLSVALSACVQKHAALSPIASDRPDATEGTSLVAPGWTQLEGGITAHGSRRYVRGSSQTFGEALLRYGAAPRLELRLEVPSIITTTGEKHELGDAGLGLKTPLLIPGEGASRAVPALSLLASTSVSTNWSTGPALGTPELILASAWSLSERVELAANAVAQPFASGAGERWVGFTVATGFAITERLGSYAELYDLGTPTVNGGVTYRLTPNFQLDARAGAIGPWHSRSRVGFVGIGFATRW